MLGHLHSLTENFCVQFTLNIGILIQHNVLKRRADPHNLGTTTVNNLTRENELDENEGNLTDPLNTKLEN